METIFKDQGALPNSGQEIAAWFEKLLREGMAQVSQMPIFTIFERETGEPVPAFQFSPGGISCTIDKMYHLTEMKDNRNCFHIVKAPLYPREFGRWSEEVEIVLSREADIDALSAETRKKIRLQANSVHEEHGVIIQDLAQDKQPTGLWIPELKEMACT